MTYSYAFLISSKHEHDLEPHGFILDALTIKQEKIELFFKKSLTHTCSYTTMDPCGRHSRKATRAVLLHYGTASVPRLPWV